MNWSALTRFDPQTLVITIETKKPEKIWLCVSDYENEKRKFTERHLTINGRETLEVMMPVSPKKCKICIFNEKNGKTLKDNSFKVLKITNAPLKTRLDVVGLQNPNVRNFVKFAQEFCFHLQELEPATYKSDNGKFFIKLLPSIVGASGRELNTPARTNKETGEIEVSKKSFYYLTIPEMMAILLHEFSHFYISDDIDDEVAADLNGLLIYLGLGYPRIEAIEAWSGVFENANNQENQERFKIIDNFIKDFEANKI